MRIFLVKPYLKTVKDIAFRVFIFLLNVLSWGFNLMVALV